MSRGPACLLDSNILLRVSRRADPHYEVIRTALVSYRRRAVRLSYTSQVLGEFWNVSTRPKAQNGFGLSIPETDLLANEIEQDFEFLPDSQAIASVSRAFPVGALMSLDTGGPVNFRPRPVEGAPDSAKQTTPRSLLLDGQQRMTS